MNNKSYKFRGGLWIGSYANSWPSGVLEVSNDVLVLHDRMMRKDYEFTRVDVEKLKIIKFIPIIGHGIRIYHKKKEYKEKIYFWYVSFRFEKLVEALKESDWLK